MLASTEMRPFLLLLLGFVTTCQAAEGPDFLAVVRRYADTMLERGRDTYGPQKSGLFLSALDRTTLAPLTSRPAPPGGIRRGDRPGRPWSAMNGANPHLDQNLLRVMYALSEITGDPRYGKAVDEELTWFFKNKYDVSQDESAVMGRAPLVGRDVRRHDQRR
jgi:hypothetical protein